MHFMINFGLLYEYIKMRNATSLSNMIMQNMCNTVNS